MSVFQEETTIEVFGAAELAKDRQEFFLMCKEFELVDALELPVAFEGLLSRLEDIHEKYASDHFREYLNLRSYTYDLFLRQVRPLLYRPGRERIADPKKDILEKFFLSNYQRIYALGMRSIVDGRTLSNVPQEAWAQVIQLDPEEERIQKQWNAADFQTWVEERSRERNLISKEDVLLIANILGKGVLPPVCDYRTQDRATFWRQEAIPPDDVARAMEQIMERLNAVLAAIDSDISNAVGRICNSNVIPVEAARAYVAVIDTHPEPDGNGRIAAGLLVLFMRLAGYPVNRVDSTRWNIARLCRYHPVALAYLAIARSRWEIGYYRKLIPDYFSHVFQQGNNTSVP